MTQITVNGININYHEAGAGGQFILIHGLSDSSALWTPLIPKLSTHYRTIALVLRGHGESDKPDMPYPIQLLSEDLLALLRKLKIPNAHVLGLSLGAAVAQQLALDHSERVCSLILLSPFSYGDSDLRENLEMLRERVLKGGVPAFFDAAIKLAVTPNFPHGQSRCYSRNALNHDQWNSTKPLHGQKTSSIETESAVRKYGRRR